MEHQLLNGQWVKLRPMIPHEIPTFYAWGVRSPFWYGEEYGSPIPTFDAFLQEWKHSYFDGSDPDKGRCFVILLDNEVIGEINYNKLELDTRSVELDTPIYRATERGKGYGPDALRTLADCLFRAKEMKSCWLDADARNKRARRAYEQAGFRRTKSCTDQGHRLVRFEMQRSEAGLFPPPPTSDKRVK